jgi:hypothetical protein
MGQAKGSAVLFLRQWNVRTHKSNRPKLHRSTNEKLPYQSRQPGSAGIVALAGEGLFLLNLLDRHF